MDKFIHGLLIIKFIVIQLFSFSKTLELWRKVLNKNQSHEFLVFLRKFKI